MNNEVLVEGKTNDIKKPDVFTLLKSKQRIDDIQSEKNNITKKLKSIYGDGVDTLSIVLEEYTIEDIKKMNKEEIQSIYDKAEKLEYENEERTEITENNKLVDLGDDIKKDFLIFCKESNNFQKQLDIEFEKFQKEIEPIQEELNKVVEEFGDLNNFVHKQLKDKYENATDEITKQRAKKSLDAFEDAVTLNRVKEYIKKYSVANLIDDYNNRPDTIYAKYIKTIKSIDIKGDITTFNNLESTILPELENKFPNIFLFTVIKMYAYKKSPTIYEDGIFISQLMVRLKMAFSNRENPTESDIIFREAVKKIVSYINQ